MGEEYEIEDEILVSEEVPEFVKLDPNSPFSPEYRLNSLDKELEYLETNYLNQIEYLMEFSKFKVLKRLIIEIEAEEIHLITPEVFLMLK